MTVLTTLEGPLLNAMKLSAIGKPIETLTEIQLDILEIVLPSCKTRHIRHA